MTKPRVSQLHQSGATDEQAIVWDSALGYWRPLPVSDAMRDTFGYPGNVSIYTGLSRLPIDAPGVILSVVAHISTAPTGADLIVDVNKNGTTIYTTQANRPRIVAGTNASSVSTNFNVSSLAAGDYLTVDIDQIGSTLPGADLTVSVRYRLDRL